MDVSGLTEGNATSESSGRKKEAREEGRGAAKRKIKKAHTRQVKVVTARGGSRRSSGGEAASACPRGA